ncbi:MAG: hypothetical protein ACO23N_03310 [Opitutales bacterium]
MLALFSRFWMGLRLLKARARHSTVRFKTADLPGLYRRFDDAGIPYVVLRWADELPLSPAEERGHARDVDHLVGNDTLDRICRISSAQPGPVSCDYYTAGGQRGGAYRGMPYYMPALAARILARRVRHPNGVWVPCPADAYHAYLYHLVYHKGHLSGIDTGLGLPTTPQATRDYAAEVRRLAAAAGEAVPETFTLLGFHEYLRAVGWAMAYDLMPRWGDRHPVLRALEQLESERDAALAQRARNLTVFVLRDDCGGERGETIARAMIGERFAILREVRLSPEAQARVVSQTRGGNWVEKGRTHPVLPTLAFLCRNADVPGPLPVPMSPAKLRRRYPHVAHTDVLIKRVIRDRVAQLDGVLPGAVVIHATDNPLEAVSTLRAVLGPDLDAFLAAST